MASLYILIPIAIMLVCVAAVVFIWAVKSDQFEDLERQGSSILFDEEEPEKDAGSQSSQPTEPHASTQDDLGRISSYTLAGAMIGGTVASLLALSDLTQHLAVLRLFAAIMMLLLAAYMAQVWNGLSYIERLGSKLWRFISPLTSKLMPLRSPLYAYPFGLVWGWLPCGLVYSALSWAAVAGSASGGGLVMLGFGLGTLPAMLTVGALAERIKPILNNHALRLICATMLALYGFYTAYSALKLLI
ncbi:cbb3-type cytochrome oxidase assembly protein CcoS [Salinivibrio sp. ML290]|uniref:cbb3-type cytochrome oxidase assembly protein CcoS n=1 Tax=Salinivibrio sp. ML290 TaxID=1909468 RepID=UPI0009884073|nr:cbb3-type cytochrome oxidase assembly protein CcoS [Salinivibrio sp. ML290]OOE75868.1 cytochrome oxidase maturation protein, cbb3-type [Salinivibrio sp. ML290]